MAEDVVRSSGPAQWAAVVLALEGMALTVFVLIEVFALAADQAASSMTAVALIVLTLIGAAALFAFAAGTYRGRVWARSGGVVLQVLALALALAALTVQPVPWAFALGVGIPGLLGLVLLITASRRDGPQQPEREIDA